MNNPLLITFHDIRHNVKIEELIKEKFGKFLSEKPDITKCHLFIEKESKHHKTSNAVIIRMDLKVPHLEDIVISERGIEDEASLSTTVIKVFKRGHELFHERMKYVRDQKRTAASYNVLVEADESETVEA